MIESSCGVPPDAGKDTLIRPEKPAGLTASIFRSGSLEIRLQAESSMTSVTSPAARSTALTVSVIGVGVGV